MADDPIDPYELANDLVEQSKRAKERREIKQARETAHLAIERGQANPLDLEDRPNPRHGTATLPPPLDEPEPQPGEPEHTT